MVVDMTQYSNSTSVHNENLRSLLQSCCELYVVISASKYVFTSDYLKSLGYLTDEGNFESDSRPFPSDLAVYGQTNLRAKLLFGSLQYCARFIPKLSPINGTHIRSALVRYFHSQML